jgi:capsular polysaccharide transport system ATP-binding protein
MIAVNEVTKAYATKKGAHVVLDHVSFEIPAGTNMGILGVNGAGKSTLLRIMSGVEAPDAGTVRRQGRISWPIGFAGGFSSSLSGEENCRFVARIYGEDVDRVTGFTHEFSELKDYFYMPIKTYSAGMKARLGFGLSMAVDFDAYLVDEVTAVGDAAFQEKCKRAFAERRGRSSVIMVSHQPATIRAYCERAAVLQRGKLRVFDTVAEAEIAYKASS